MTAQAAVPSTACAQRLGLSFAVPSLHPPQVRNDALARNFVKQKVPQAMQLLINAKPRRGAMIPLFAILLIPLLAMLAFSIDAGWMVLTRTDLQNTADAAALAGAEKLQEMWVQYYSPGQVSQSTILTQAVTNSGPGSPMATAEKFSALNKAGNVNITLLDQDVTFGFTDAQGHYTSPYLGGFPNTIQVIVRRDGVAN